MQLSDPGNPYGFDKQSLATYEKHVAQLASHTQFWPPTKLTRRAADKWTTLCHLQIIAQNTRRYTPRAALLVPGEVIPPDAVLKRSHSECGTHVLLPSAKPELRTWEHLTSNATDGTFWMMQEYVPSLEWLGEWRVLVVGGKIIAVMHTIKLRNGEWVGRPVHAFRSLEEVAYVSLCAFRFCLIQL